MIFLPTHSHSVISITTIGQLLICFFLSSAAYSLLVLPVGGASPGIGGGRPTVGRNWALVFGWHTSPHNSDAPANTVWVDVRHVQVSCMLFTQHHAPHSNVQQ